MGKATLKGLLAHKFRLAATALAIVRREMGIMTVAALFVAALSFRAAQVSGGF